MRHRTWLLKMLSNVNEQALTIPKYFSNWGMLLKLKCLCGWYHLQISLLHLASRIVKDDLVGGYHQRHFLQCTIERKELLYPLKFSN